MLAEGSNNRQLATMDFLREVAKIGGIRHEVSAIYKRWISGSGCPKITAAYLYNRQVAHQPNSLLVETWAILHSGSSRAKAVLDICRSHVLTRGRTSCLHDRGRLCEHGRGIEIARRVRVMRIPEACMHWPRKRSVLELAIQQSGSAASMAAAEDASGSGKEGSSAGILKVITWR